MDLHSLLFLFQFLAMWFAVHFALALIDGWGALAKNYSCDGDITDNWKGWQTGYFGWVHYRSCLWVAATPKGLCLKTGPLFFFRAFHPPLCIPWEAFDTVKERQFFWVRFYDFHTSSPNVKISVQASAVEDGKRFYAQQLTLS
jgi:hypothetical protein